MDEWEKDEMGSLFEGMVLFSPSQMAPDPEDGEQHNNHHHISTDPPPPIIDASASPLPLSSSVSHPLDENIFSDLTLIPPPQTLEEGEGLQNYQSDPSRSSSYAPGTSPISATAASTSTSTSTSTTAATVTRSQSVPRQLSTRKKKRGGLRIGYGRDTASTHDDHLQDLNLDLAQSSDAAEIGLGDADTQQEEIEEKNREEEEPSSSPTPDPPLPSSTVSVGNNDLPDKNYIHVVDSFSTRIDNGLLQLDKSVPGPTVHLSPKDAQEEEDKQLKTCSSRSIELRFEQIRSLISEKLNHARESVDSVSAARKDAIRRRRKANNNLSLASTNYKQLEKELENACEAEDFETAEKVSLSLSSAEKDKELAAVALRDAEADCDAIDYKLQEVLELQITAEEECATLLETFSTEAANDADSILKNAEVMSSTQMEEWFSVTEALEVKKMEVEIESHLVNEFREVLNGTIEHSVEDDRREIELLCKKKENLTEELEKLRALVKEKEMEIAENDANIKRVEKKIMNVASRFQEEQSDINKKYDNLQSDLSQIQCESEALSLKKMEIDDFLSQENLRGTKIRELARTSADEANMYQEVVELRKSLVHFILKSMEGKVSLFKTEENLSKDVQMLKQEVSAGRASHQELSSTKSSIQQEIESSRQKILFIDKRIPELETEKKVAASARNFKEAARIASESKTLSLEKEGALLKIEEAMSKLSKIEESLSETVNRMQSIDEKISSKERELAMARFQRLLLIAGAARAERSAALELGDLEEAKMLLAEAEAADAEARKLQPLYDLKDEEFTQMPKRFISMELLSTLGGKQLAELATSVLIPSM